MTAYHEGKSSLQSKVALFREGNNNDQAKIAKIMTKLCLTTPFSKCCKESHCKMCFWYSSQDPSVCCSAKPQALLRARQEFENAEPSFSPLMVPGARPAGRAWAQPAPQLPSCPQPGKVPVLNKRLQGQGCLEAFPPEWGWRGSQIMTSSPVNTWTGVQALPLLHKASTRSSRGLTAYKASALAWNSPWQESKVWNRKYNYFTSPLCSYDSTAA